VAGSRRRSDHGSALRERHTDDADANKIRTPPRATGATSEPHKRSGYQACTMRRVAPVSATTHETRVLTQAHGAEPYRGMLRVGAQCACAENIGREEGPSLLIHPWPVDPLELMSTPKFRPPQCRRRSVHHAAPSVDPKLLSERKTIDTYFVAGAAPGVGSCDWWPFDRQRPRGVVVSARRYGHLREPEAGAPTC
jgi:hypothetical protein